MIDIYMNDAAIHAEEPYEEEEPEIWTCQRDASGPAAMKKHSKKA